MRRNSRDKSDIVCGKATTGSSTRSAIRCSSSLSSRSHIDETSSALACPCYARLVEAWHPADVSPTIADAELRWQPAKTVPPLLIDLGAYFRAVFAE